MRSGEIPIRSNHLSDLGITIHHRPLHVNNNKAHLDLNFFNLRKPVQKSAILTAMASTTTNKHPLLLAAAVAHGVLALGHTVRYQTQLKPNNALLVLMHHRRKAWTSSSTHPSVLFQPLSAAPSKQDGTRGASSSPSWVCTSIYSFCHCS